MQKPEYVEGIWAVYDTFLDVHGESLVSTKQVDVVLSEMIDRYMNYVKHN